MNIQGNILINRLDRNTNNIYIEGTARMRVNGSYFWYSDPVNGKVTGNDWWQYKGRTYGSILTGTNYDHNFACTISAPPTATTATITAWYQDPLNPSFDKIDTAISWTLTFPKSETPAKLNDNNHALTNPSVWKITDTISGIDWGINGSKKHLKAVVSYTFQGVNYSYVAFEDTNYNGTSKTITIDKSNTSTPWVNGVPAGTQIKVVWTADNGVGSSSSTKTVNCVSPKDPTIPNNINIANPSVYRLTSGTTGITYGDWKLSQAITAIVRYTLDGTDYQFTAYSNTNAVTNPSFDLKGLVEAPNAPWTKVPDDEDATVTWTVTLNVGYKTLSATKTASIRCMPSYDAYVIESGVNNGNPVAADLIVSNFIGGAPTANIRRITEISD